MFEWLGYVSKKILKARDEEIAFLRGRVSELIVRNEMLQLENNKLKPKRGAKGRFVKGIA